MAPRTDEKILENRIASLQDMYVNDESLRKKHLAGRLRESYEVYSEIALEEHRKKYGDVPAVLVGKHFTWGLIDIASRYGLDISDYLGMCLANNPEKPGEVFLKEFGKIYTGMESDLKRIAEELSGEK
ncbi:MAG: hypothetical protein KKE20_03280, partial [Nanoarchaeota archaeon]|nr:hypothetical protein [Nanoarchaeota archaeon]